MDLYDRNIWNRRVIINKFMLVYGMAREWDVCTVEQDQLWL